MAKLKAHARIVWGLAWSPDSRLLATGSRDNSVKLWAAPPPRESQPQQQPQQQAPPRDGTLVLLATLPFADAVRAVAFAPLEPADGTAAGGSTAEHREPAGLLCYGLAVGLEDGSVHIVDVQCREGTSSGGSSSGEVPVAAGGLCLAQHRVAWQSGQYDQHAAAVRRLCWRRDVDSSSAGGALPGPAAAGGRRFHLASCGDDHAVRVYSIQL